MEPIEDIIDVEALAAGGSPDDDKLRELILYISWMCEGDPTFGATKLNKILLFADFRAYAQLGRAITWQEYQCLAQGPAPRQLKPVRESLERAGELAIRIQDFYGHDQHRTIALRRPDLSRFSAEEVAIVALIIQEWWGKTVTEMSRTSHALVGWQLAALGETIPYQTALFQDHEPTTEEVRMAASLDDLATNALLGLTS
jgi:hypothetical protein